MTPFVSTTASLSSTGKGLFHFKISPFSTSFMLVGGGGVGNAGGAGMGGGGGGGNGASAAGGTGVAFIYWTNSLYPKNPTYTGTSVTGTSGIYRYIQLNSSGTLTF
jgi:hypothetical protein